MTLLDLFSGIGGFAKGLMQAGFHFDWHFNSEIDKHASANYQYNFPDSSNLGSVTAVRSHQLPRPNIITFGSPCQDFSVAGQRSGMDGQRSSLILQAMRLIAECRPDIFIWENVKGAFSTNDGADFWAIVQAFANIGGYRLEWQLLNTDWFLPQNRERVYLIGHLDGRSRPGVFPFTERDFPHPLAAGAQTVNCLDANYSKGVDNHGQRTVVQVGDYRLDSGFRWRQDGNSPTINARARQDGSGQPIIKVVNGTPYSQSDRVYDSEGLAPTLRRGSQNSGTVVPNIQADTGIRRLTEIECERLQGFPDNWTRYGIYNYEVKSVPKTQRYRMVGNAVTVNVVEAIGKRLHSCFTH
ncbi:DNA cytosine methyltransferase [Larkinella soli]|uniref:DNA cytosine methyltransferase n=1 Tax=Larkinella soli TaxID=1770527 RepID=UPI000FFC93B8|nr:DNA (cytosine-5-)-methyltransferase [Larkinella soli]